MHKYKEGVKKQLSQMNVGLGEWALSQTVLDTIVIQSKELISPHWRMRLYLHTKRGIDILLSLFLLIITSPIILLAAIIIKCTSRGPVLFRQPRAGINGIPFTIYKFRSMYNGAEKDRFELSGYNDIDEGPCFKVRQDPRLTLIGRFLRRSSIDELPQLYNVLKGEMSLVGPRPLPLLEVETSSYAERARLCVRPGISCLWQISGRTEIPYHEWMLLDLYYIKHRSLMLDLEILIKTIPAVLSCRGAY
ncbi:MAG: sugar transferase [Planctomycetota bacterium]|nr:MAG: sugar transferase [Planctomycetota bacterium]